MARVSRAEARAVKSAVLACLAEGLTVREACACAGRSMKTYEQWRANDPEFAAAADSARAGLYSPPEPPALREGFWAQVPQAVACWEWGGHVEADGYGRYRRGYAHRHAFEQAVGPIPEGMTIDHLCRNRACVNPLHLEVVTLQENVMRGYFARLKEAASGPDES